MAGNIKGITIEIDGDVKKLNSALKSANQNIKDTQYQLRDVEKALKFNPGNTEMLEQKFKLLGQSVTEAKDKLNLLEEAQRQAADQLARGEIGQADYDALSAKVEAARGEVEKFQAAYDEFGSVQAQQFKAALEEINQSLDGTKGKLEDVDKALQLNPGNTDLLQTKFELLGQAVEEASDKVTMLEEAEALAADQLANGEIGIEQYADLQVELENARAEADQLRQAYVSFGSVALQKVSAVGEKIVELGTKTEKLGNFLNKYVSVPVVAAGSAGVAAFKSMDEAMDTVTKKTGATGGALEDMQNRAKEIAETVPTSFQAAADAVGEVNTRFGLTGDALSDLSTKFVKFADLNDTDVSSSIDNVQTVMAAWGVETEDAGLLLDTLTKAGQDTGVSVDTLSQALSSNKTYLDEMGFSLSDSAMFLANLDKNGVDANATLAGMKKALVNATKEGKTSKEALSELQDTIANSTDKTEAYQKAMELFGNKAGPAIADAVMEGRLSFEELGTTLEDFSGTTENTFKDTLDPIDQMTTALNTAKDIAGQVGGMIFETLNPALQKLNDYVKKAKESFEKLSPKTKDTIVKFGLIAAAIGPVLSVGSKLTKFFGGIISLAPKLGAAISFLTGPFGLVVLAIAAVIAIVALVIKNWDWLKQKAQEVGQVISQAWNQMKTNVSNSWNQLKTNAAAAWQEIKNRVTENFNIAKNAVSTAADNIKTKVSTTWDNVKSGTAAKWSEIKNTVSTKASEVKTAVSTAWENVKTNTSAKWNEIKTTVSTKVSEVKNTISNGWGNLKQNVSGVFDGIKNTMSKPFTDAKAAISDAIQKIKNLFPIRLGNIFSGIKLPTLHYSPGKFPYGVGGKGYLPKFSWYRKAYTNAVMFNDPTVLATPSGYKGFGDGNGSEIVMGKDYMLGMIQEAVSGSSLSRNMAAVGQILEAFLPMIANKEFVLSGQDFVYANKQGINAALGNEAVLTARGVR